VAVEVDLAVWRRRGPSRLQDYPAVTRPRHPSRSGRGTRHWVWPVSLAPAG
jgi:hypothetical protein